MKNKVFYKRSVIFLIFFALLQAIANNLAHAVTVAKMIHIHAPDWMVGSYFAVMSLGAFIYLPFSGKLSDKIGRKKVFLISTFVYAFSQLMFLIDQNPYTIHLWRFISGSGGVQFSMIVLMISDYSDQKSLKQVMIWYTLMVNIGEGFGKFIGGQVGNINYTHTFILQVLCQIGLFILIGLFFKNKQNFNTNHSNDEKITDNTTNSNKKEFKFFTRTNTLLIFTIIVLINYYCKVTFSNSITLFGQKNLHFSVALIGDYMLVLSGVMIFSLLVLSPYLMKRLDLHVNIFITLIVSSVVWFLVYFVNVWQFDITIIWVYLCVNVIFESTINTFVISKTSEERKGQVLGIVSSFRFLGNMIGSFASGFLYEISPKLPFLFPGFLLLIAAYFFIKKYKWTEKEIVHDY